ncbi:ATP-binding protein [Streptomyces lonarensis]|uniref:uridine kinase family protein n=2 Tax=Streptomyces lonarensis TaxID=700599 RepID=UPI0030C77E62
MTSSAPARVILLTGPSGSGKSRLAARTGLPVVRLDDFYKDGDDPSLPALPSGAGTDWDSPASWNGDRAVLALRELCERGTAELPEYSIARSARTGSHPLTLDGAPLVVAEGIFAAEIGAACAELGLLADSICLADRPTTHFRRRLARDVRESRKPLPFLLRRGWALLRAERSIVAHNAALGAHCCDQRAALRRIGDLAAADRTAPAAPPAPRPRGEDGGRAGGASDTERLAA